jgi:hypothetical protein
MTGRTLQGRRVGGEAPLSKTSLINPHVIRRRTEREARAQHCQLNLW